MRSIWAYVRDERPWSGQSPPCAWYQFTVDRRGAHPVKHLSGYQGWVHADGYSGFNGVFGEGKADEVACMAHIRRKFVDVQQASGSSRAVDLPTQPQIEEALLTFWQSIGRNGI